MQGFRRDTGVPAFSISAASFSPSDTDASFLDDLSSDDALETTHSFFAESSTHYTFGILSALSIPTTTTPVKTLKFNDISIIVQLLSLQDSRLADNRWKTSFSNTNSLKYSSKYYIYNLAHILI